MLRAEKSWYLFSSVSRLFDWRIPVLGEAIPTKRASAVHDMATRCTACTAANWLFDGASQWKARRKLPSRRRDSIVKSGSDSQESPPVNNIYLFGMLECTPSVIFFEADCLRLPRCNRQFTDQYRWPSVPYAFGRFCRIFDSTENLSRHLGFSCFQSILISYFKYFMMILSVVTFTI